MDKDTEIKRLQSENARLKALISQLQAELHRAKHLDPSIPIVMPKGRIGGG